MKNNIIKNLPKLKVFWLESNPISKDTFYKEKVMNILSRLNGVGNKNLILHKYAKKRGQSEEQKQNKNESDYNTNFIKSNIKKFY